MNLQYKTFSLRTHCILSIDTFLTYNTCTNIWRLLTSFVTDRIGCGYWFLVTQEHIGAPLKGLKTDFYKFVHQILTMQHCKLKNKNQTHHANVEVLVHLAEGMWWRLALAGDDDADVCHCQGVLRLDGWCSAEGDENALRGGGAVVDVGAAAIRCGLDDLAALDQTLLTLVQDTDKHNQRCKY